MSDHKNWPAWHYGPGGESAIFECSADVPDGWKDSPHDVDAPKDEKAELVALAESRGVEVDKRWGVKRLKAELGV